MSEILQLASGWVALITLPVCTYFLKQIADEFRDIKNDVADHRVEIEVLKTRMGRLDTSKVKSS